MTASSRLCDTSPASADARWFSAVRRLQWHLYLRDIEPLRSQVHSYCKALTRGRPEAQDLTQETLLRGFSVVSQLCRSPNKPLAFLCRIARNLWIDRQRKVSKAQLLKRDVHIEPEPDASRWCEFQQNLGLLEHALPQREREVFVLKELLGYTSPEVAFELGTSMASAKMAASRARRRLLTQPKENE